MPVLQWFRTNNVALNITLANWAYRTSDKLQLYFRQNSRGAGNWPAILGPNNNYLYLQYNYFSRRSCINVRHGSAYSGDGAYSYSSVDDFTSFYMVELDGSNFSINKGNSFDTLSPILTATLGTADDVNRVIPVLYPDNGSNYPDHVFYRLTVYRNGELIHDYRPYSGGSIYDLVDGAHFITAHDGYIDGPTAIQTYTVHFNANSGTGTMSDQIIETDTDTALEENLFTKADSAFIGWATSPNGPAVYADGEIVRNIAPADQTITLYAVWATGMGIDIQYNSSENICLDKNLETLFHCVGKLREGCTVTNPDILIEAPLEVIAQANYCTIPIFKRSFYINGYTSEANSLIWIHCTVDPLSSFKDAIRNNYGIVHRSEQQFNLYINDGSLVAYQNPHVLTEPFPSGFTAASFVLATAGA